MLNWKMKSENIVIGILKDFDNLGDYVILFGRILRFVYERARPIVLHKMTQTL